MDKSSHSNIVVNSPGYSALRLDPGRLYNVVPEGAPGETEVEKVARAARQVVDDAIRAGFKAIFVIAYSPVHGAYYPTSYEYSKMEQGYGRLGLLQSLIEAAGNDLEVIASFHVNNFQSVYEQQPDWREKRENQTDYNYPEKFPLSPYHPAYREWFKGLLVDFLTIHPQIDGLEAFEGYVDYEGPFHADFNEAATHDFQLKHGEAEPLKGAVWKKHRAQGLTELHGILFDVAKEKQKKSFVVQTWTAKPSGELWSINAIRDTFGFDFDEITNLRPHAVAVQLIWQQWAHLNRPTEIFTPEWTETAGREARALLAIPEDVQYLIHVELTDFATEGNINTRWIPVEEFQRALELALSVADGITVYDYVFLRKAYLMT
ncbi:MAG: hypothetical protein SD837_12400 [Candidatus Electrothrix scaldis]|nr:MAG: hypothetical protein SD837_12400 [Candidatus Electrothrix sp. GW3-3]